MNYRLCSVAALLLAVGVAGSIGGASAKYITVMAPGGADIKSFLDEVAKDFRKENPKVDVHIVQANAQEQIEKTSTMLIGGIPPEVIWTSNRYSANWLDRLVFRDLRPYMKQDKLEPSTFVGAAYRDMGRAGQQAGLPMDVGLMIYMFYPKAFAQAGLPTPLEAAQGDQWTYDSWIKALQRLTVTKSGAATPSQYGMLSMVSYTPDLADWICAGGGRILSADNSKSLLHEPKALAGLQTLLDMKRKYGVVKRDGQGGVAPGKVAMWYSAQNWATVLSLAAKERIDYAFRPVPTSGTDPHHTLLVNHVSMFKACKEPNLGWKFLKLMVSQKWQLRMGVLTGRVQDLVSAMPAFTETMKSYVYHPEVLSKALSSYSEGLPVNKWWMRVQNTLEPAVGAAFDNPNKALGPALEAISKQLDLVLKDNAVRK